LIVHGLSASGQRCALLARVVFALDFAITVQAQASTAPAALRNPQHLYQYSSFVLVLQDLR
jgi:hypothetical protein